MCTAQTLKTSEARARPLATKCLLRPRAELHHCVVLELQPRTKMTATL